MHASLTPGLRQSPMEFSVAPYESLLRAVSKCSSPNTFNQECSTSNFWKMIACCGFSIFFTKLFDSDIIARLCDSRAETKSPSEWCQECPTEPILKMAAAQAKLCWLGQYFTQKICWEFCKLSIVAGKMKCFLLPGRRKKKNPRR